MAGLESGKQMLWAMPWAGTRLFPSLCLSLCPSICPTSPACSPHRCAPPLSLPLSSLSAALSTSPPFSLSSCFLNLPSTCLGLPAALRLHLTPLSASLQLPHPLLSTPSFPPVPARPCGSPHGPASGCGPSPAPTVAPTPPAALSVRGLRLPLCNRIPAWPPARIPPSSRRLHPSRPPRILPPPTLPPAPRPAPCPAPPPPKGLTLGKGPESPDGDVSVPERKDEVAGGGGEEEEAEERGRVGGRGGPRPAASAGPHLRPPRRGEAQEGGPGQARAGEGGPRSPPGPC